MARREHPPQKGGNVKPAPDRPAPAPTPAATAGAGVRRADAGPAPPPTITYGPEAEAKILAALLRAGHPRPVPELAALAVEEAGRLGVRLDGDQAGLLALKAIQGGPSASAPPPLAAPVSPQTLAPVSVQTPRRVTTRDRSVTVRDPLPVQTSGHASRPAQVHTKDSQDLQVFQEFSRTDKGCGAGEDAGVRTGVPGSAMNAPEKTPGKKKPPKLPPPLTLEDGLLAAVKAHFVAEAEAADVNQDGPVDWASPLWTFARACHAVPALAKIDDPSQAFAAIELGLLKRTSDGNAEKLWGLFKVTREAAQSELLDIWGKIRCPLGVDILEAALIRADAKPFALRDAIRRKRSQGYPRFVSLAGWLQVIRGHQPIALAQCAIGDRLGVDQATVSRYVKWAMEDGYIVKVRGPVIGKAGAGRAAEFFFDVRRITNLPESAAPGLLEWLEKEWKAP